MVTISAKSKVQCTRGRRDLTWSFDQCLSMCLSTELEIFTYKTSLVANVGNTGCDCSIKADRQMSGLGRS